MVREFHETLNLAALWKLPVLFCCENNLYAMGTSIAKEHAQPEIALRAESYGMAAWPVDGMDVFAVETAARRAVEAIRGGAGPHLLELLRAEQHRGHMGGVARRRDQRVVGEVLDDALDEINGAEQYEDIKERTFSVTVSLALN